MAFISKKELLFAVPLSHHLAAIKASLLNFFDAKR
jgi:hypothetical protein